MTRQLRHRGKDTYADQAAQSGQRAHVFWQPSHHAQLTWQLPDESRRADHAVIDQCPIIVFEQSCRYLCQSLCGSTLDDDGGSTVWQPVVKKMLPKLIHVEAGAGASNYTVLLHGSEKRPRTEAARRAAQRKCKGVTAWETASRRPGCLTDKSEFVHAWSPLAYLGFQTCHKRMRRSISPACKTWTFMNC